MCIYLFSKLFYITGGFQPTLQSALKDVKYIRCVGSYLELVQKRFCVDKTLPLFWAKVEQDGMKQVEELVLSSLWTTQLWRITSTKYLAVIVRGGAR